MSLTLRQIPSPNYGGSRGTVIWIIVHTAEGALTVDSLGSFFASKSSGVSSHVGIDDHEIVQYVPYSGQAWTARSANPYADQAELCGFAAWTRAEWLTHTGMLENTAQWIADRCQARGVPAVKIGPNDVAARKPGVIGHVDITNGLHDGTHTDPGTSFPWDVVMARVNEILTGADMPLSKDDVTAVANAVWAFNVSGKGTQAQDRLYGVDAVQLPALAKAVAAISTASPAVNVDAGAVAAALADNTAFLAALAKAVNDDAAARLKS